MRDQFVATDMRCGHSCQGRAGISCGDDFWREVQIPVQLMLRHRQCRGPINRLISNVGKSLSPKQLSGHILRRKAGARRLLESDCGDFRRRVCGKGPGCAIEPSTGNPTETGDTELGQETAPALLHWHCVPHASDRYRGHLIPFALDLLQEAPVSCSKMSLRDANQIFNNIYLALPCGVGRVHRRRQQRRRVDRTRDAATGCHEADTDNRKPESPAPLIAAPENHVQKCPLWRGGAVRLTDSYGGVWTSEQQTTRGRCPPLRR